MASRCDKGQGKEFLTYSNQSFLTYSSLFKKKIQSIYSNLFQSTFLNQPAGSLVSGRSQVHLGLSWRLTQAKIRREHKVNINEHRNNKILPLYLSRLTAPAALATLASASTRSTLNLSKFSNSLDKK